MNKTTEFFFNPKSQLFFLFKDWWANARMEKLRVNTTDREGQDGWRTKWINTCTTTLGYHLLTRGLQVRVNTHTHLNSIRNKLGRTCSWADDTSYRYPIDGFIRNPQNAWLNFLTHPFMLFNKGNLFLTNNVAAGTYPKRFSQNFTSQFLPINFQHRQWLNEIEMRRWGKLEMNFNKTQIADSAFLDVNIS